MASSSSSSSFALAIALTTTIALLGSTPAQGMLNLTEILERGQQYTTLIHLLDVTQAGNQIQNQLNNSHDGVTIFAPTNNAFSNLKAGVLNSLSQQKQVAFVLYHVLPKFYTLESFQTASNPLRTQASGNGGDFYLNVSSSAQQVNVSTGIVTVSIRSLNVTEPLAVYSVDKVLRPYDLFGPKKKSSAPAPSAEDEGGKKSTPALAEGKNETSSPAGDQPAAAATRIGGWRRVVGLALVGALMVM